MKQIKVGDKTNSDALNTNNNLTLFLFDFILKVQFLFSLERINKRCDFVLERLEILKRATVVWQILPRDWNLPLNNSGNRFLFRNYAPLKNAFTTTPAWNIPRTMRRVFSKSRSANGYFQKIGNSRYSARSGHDFLVTRSRGITRQTRVPSQPATFENVSDLLNSRSGWLIEKLILRNFDRVSDGVLLQVSSYPQKIVRLIL